MLKIDDTLTARDLLPAIRTAVRAVRPEDRAPRAPLGPGARARRCSPCAGNTPPAAGPSGPRASSSAPPSCSSTPPARARSWRSGATPPSSGWPRTSPTSACTTTASTTSAPTATCCACMREGRIADDPWERRFYELALKVTGAVQAARWTRLSPELGYIYSFNGPHSLFADTIRSLRALAVSPPAGPRAHGRGRQADLAARAPAPARRGHRPLQRLLRQRAATPTTCAAGWPTSRSSTSTTAPTAAPRASRAIRPSPPGRAAWPGWSAAIPSSSSSCPPCRPRPSPGWATSDRILARFLETAQATADFFIANTPVDGVPYWDTGAPGLAHLGRLPRAPRRSLQRPRAGRQLRRRHRRAGADPPRQLPHRPGRQRAGRGATGRPASPWRAPCSRRALPLHRSGARGAAAALGLPPAQRLGPRARRAAGAGWRVLHVGRLPRARAGAAAAAPGRGPALSDASFSKSWL